MGRFARMMCTAGVALMLAACGGGSDGGEGGGSAPLSMTDNAFDPTTLTVSSGDSVELSNDGQALHNLTVEGADIDQDVQAGQSATVTMDLEPGEYTMFCEYHRSAGMEGSVTVQ